MTNINHHRLTTIQNYVTHQYAEIALGNVSHGQALYNIIDLAESLNRGNYEKTIRDVKLVVIGENVYRNGFGKYHAPFTNQPHLEGSVGFKTQYQDGSIQIVHAVAGLYMASEYGDFGTAAAQIRELYTNLKRGSIEYNDLNLFSATEFIQELAAHNKFMSDLFGRNKKRLAEIVRETIFNNSVKPPSCFLAGTMISMWDGSEKPIEQINADDVVTSYDKDGNPAPGRVKRTMQNRAKYILDFHGLMTTPGHAFYCAEG
ncbi:MAG: hypothetical protein JKY49_09275, partial [Cohaesibacteraceae bacterium]|nr:hypothetical protein [Cohaesibacteraceae bacterium]